MPKLRMTFEAAITPQQFVEALTDFGPERGRMWAHSTADYLKVHDKRETFADVTEGSRVFGGAWERVHYDWSDPHMIILQTVDSNIWDNTSGWTYELKPAVDGTITTIHYTVERFPRNNKGRLLLVFMGVYGKRILRKDFEKLLKRIEERG
ncbi:MAG: hypothetical protein QFB86_02425 [Patescibacteria group bacterium]|nr:hypothetical protein [Patescibacteria group bacterium]